MDIRQDSAGRYKVNTGSRAGKEGNLSLLEDTTLRNSLAQDWQQPH